MLETRTKNRVFEGKNLAEFFINYGSAVIEASKSVDSTSLNQAFELIETNVKSGSTIYVAGNGGSAAISDHLCCDWSKGTSFPGQKPMRTLSFASNTALITALGNDYGFETIFREQLRYLAKEGDLLILISSSGNSPNIVEAAKLAKELGVKIIGFSGFSGGKLKELADISLHVAFDNYGIVEDVHQMLMHSISQLIIRLRSHQA